MAGRKSTRKRAHGNDDENYQPAQRRRVEHTNKPSSHKPTTPSHAAVVSRKKSDLAEPKASLDEMSPSSAVAQLFHLMSDTQSNPGKEPAGDGTEMERTTPSSSTTIASSQSAAANTHSHGEGCALQTVLATTEIIEKTFEHLSAKRIFVTQRVCKSFRSVIANSPSIQRKIFNQLDGKPEETWFLSAMIFVPPDVVIQRVLKVGSHTPGENQGSPFTVATLNPCFAIDSQPQIFSAHLEGNWVDVTLDPAILGNFWHQPYCDNQDHTYLDTYISDPPCRSVSVDMIYLLDSSSKKLPRKARHKRVKACRLITSGEGEKALTIREMMTKALALEGEAFFETLNGHWKGDRKTDSTSVSAAIESIIKGHSRWTVQGAVRFQLQGVVIPINLQRSIVERQNSFAIQVGGLLFDFLQQG